MPSPPAPCFVVLNAASGSQQARDAREVIARQLADAGCEHHIDVVREPSRLPRAAQQAVAQASREAGVVVAAGGDGTLNAVAQAVLGSDCLFGVVPLGTFNYFARTHGIPTDVGAAAQLLCTAQPHPVQAGLVNGQIFLVNASLGLYPQLLEDREAYKRQFGRRRWVAWWAGLMALLREHRQLQIWLEHAGHGQHIRTPTLFVGNNALQLSQLGLEEAAAVQHQGLLAGLMLEPMSTGSMLWLGLRGALGQLGEARQVRSFVFRQLCVRPAQPYGRRGLKVAVDGEIHRLQAPLNFAVAASPLMLLKPGPDAGPPPA